MILNICDVATFVLSLLNANETNDLATVHSEIFHGPPTSFVSRSTHNRVKKRKRSSDFINFIQHLKIYNPNLHLLQESLLETDLNQLTLEWRAPFVRATTAPAKLNLSIICPNLKSVSVKEPYKEADFCLPFFKMIEKMPKRLKHLDFREVHFSSKNEIVDKIISLSHETNTFFCECMLSFVDKIESHWNFTPCPVFSSKDNIPVIQL